MTERSAVRLGLVAWFVAAACGAAGFLLMLQGGYAAGRWSFPGYEAVIAVPAVTVGAIVSARRRENPVGWMILFGGLIYAVTFALDEYARTSLSDGLPGRYPATAFAAWIASWGWIPGVLFLFGSLWVFPDGRLPSPRWRLAFRLSTTLVVVFAGAMALGAGPLLFYPIVDNPFGLVSWTDTLRGVAYVGLLMPALGALAASLVVRFRASRGTSRAQMKWLVYVAAFSLVPGVPAWLGVPVASVLQVAANAAIPVAVGIAVLRYRLYEIDLLINRTIVYLALTGVLAAVYAVSISVFERLLASVVGGTTEAVTVATTLLIVALFTPVKTVLQNRVDQRWKVPHAHETGSGHGSDPLASIERLAGLHDRGVISATEFETKKMELLARL